jgi:hypothetical protein
LSNELISEILTSLRKSLLSFWGMLFILGAIGWLVCTIWGDASRAWRAMLGNYIFFTPLACGMIVWPAIVLLCHGAWAAPIQRYAFSALAFAPVSLAAFIILWIGYPHWASWTSMPDLPQGFWLHPAFVFIRDITALIIIWLLAAAFVKKSQKEISLKLAGWLCFAYCIVFSLIGFDMVMALDPHWFSTLFGGYFFVSGMYAALVAWTFFSVYFGTSAAETRHDLAGLIVAASLLTTYLMFSQLLPIWYENLPQEVRFILPRLTITKWPYISVVLLCTIYLGPLVLLLTRWSKRSPVFLSFVCLLMLAGLWIERLWEINPSIEGQLTFGLTELSITAAFTASFIISMKIFGTRLSAK